MPWIWCRFAKIPSDFITISYNFFAKNDRRPLAPIFHEASPIQMLYMLPAIAFHRHEKELPHNMKQLCLFTKITYLIKNASSA